MTEQEIKELQDKLAALTADLQKANTRATDFEKQAQTSTDQVNTLTKQIEALNQSIKDREAALEADADESGDVSKLYKIALSKLEQQDKDLADRDTKIQELETKQAENEAKALQNAKVKAVKEALGPALQNEKVLMKMFNWDKVVPEKTEDGSIKFNKDGMAQAIDEFAKEVPQAVDFTNNSPQGQAAQGGKVNNPNDTFEARVDKIPGLLGN